MNLQPVFPKNIFIFLLPALLVFAGPAAAKNSVQETKTETIEIQAAQERRIEEEARTAKPVAEIREVGQKMPEIPQPITRKHLEGADQARLDDLESKYASGQLTQMEYEIEKDKLARDSNVKF